MGNSKKPVIWGMSLLGIGLLTLIVGIAVWIVMGVFTSYSPDSELSIFEGVSVSGLCCFGPFAFIGGILAIVGGVLWWTHRH